MTAPSEVPREHLGRSSGYSTKVFESLDALADYAAGTSYRSSGGDSWAGGTFAQALRWTRDGDAAFVARSDALLAKFESLCFPTTRREWRNDVAGFVPNVPAHVAGLPTSMRRRPRREAPAAPITIHVDLFLSAGFSAEAALARGAAILALVRILATTRAVSLYVGYGTTESSGRTTCPVVRLNTTPLDLAHAAYVLCSTSFVRRVLLATMERMSPGSHRQGWPSLRGSLHELAREVYGDGTELLLIPGGLVLGRAGDPSEWIEARLREAGVAVIGDGGNEAA